MTMAEIIRQLMDKLEEIGAAAQAQPEPEPAKQPMMIPPLQAKLELLKKAVGVESYYDNESQAKPCGCMGECSCNNSDPELDILKRNAGISPAAIQIAADDEPLE